MPVVLNLSLDITEEAVFRRQEIRDSERVHPSVKSVTRELLKSKNEFLDPAMAYEIYPVIEKTSTGICLPGGKQFEGRSLVSLIGPAQEIAVVLCTLGAALETRAGRYFHSGESLKGFLLDGLGSAAVDALAVRACSIIQSVAACRGFTAGGPLSPGMFGWDIKDLPVLIELAPSRQIGLSLTSGGMLSPRKSLAMVIGLGRDMPRRNDFEICEYCNLRETCRQRR